ncbi:unnamed protein product [Adineta steineri]|uniref:F-box domain-containing protein n=4 Tax=Adineta steineri TaxID=433720 RepID=A0A815CG72_9BILA|nr:unnamed protein product [Adineta steineri]
MSRNKIDVQDSSPRRAIAKSVPTLSDESTSYTRLENLSNELLCEIFEYLDAYDAYKSFSNLNIRLQNLIVSSSILLRIELDSKSTSLIKDRCQHVIIPNSHRILSLHVADYSNEQLLIDAFFNHCIINSSFHRLESIILKRIEKEKLLTTLFYFNSLPRLFSLVILIKDNNYCDLGNIYPLIFSLSLLKYNKLITSSDKLTINIPHVINKTFSTIEYLVTGHSCTLNQLNTLLHYTPQLRHLSCHQVNESDKKFKKDLSMKLPHLKSIYFVEFSASFDELEAFIEKICSQLQMLNIGVCYDKAYLNGNRWERLIKEYMPELEKFYFNFTPSSDDDRKTNSSYSSDGFIHQFNSPFWLERKLFRELEVNSITSTFSIRSYRKEYNYISNREKIDHGIIQLTIGNNEYTKLDRPYIKKLKSAVKAIQFTHLDIDNDNLTIKMLLDILHMLPNIESLKLSSIPIFPLESLSIEDIKNNLPVSAINKITQVKLGQVTEDDEEEIEFFINLCPHIEYLEVECMSDTDVPLLMKFIMNQRIRIPKLCYLCFINPIADDNMVRSLAMTIDSETVNDNYTIQRSGDKISVHWKL